jgi:hypothetical protein
MEIWIEIPDFPDYEISSDGRIRNKNSGKIIKPQETSGGYMQVTLYKNRDSKRYNRSVHQLVAYTFYDVDKPGLDINHQDGRKFNNAVSNLEFLTRSENLKHAYNNGLKVPCGYYTPRKIRIVETGECFDSILLCARYLNATHNQISKCLRYPHRNFRGLHFEYTEEK